MQKRKKERYLKIGSIALCVAMVFSSSASLLAASEETYAYKDTLEQKAAEEAQKRLFTLKEVQDMARSRGIETLNAKSDLAIAEAAKEAADMAFYNARYDASQPGPTNVVEAAIAGAVANQEQAIIALDDAKTKVESQMEAAVYTAEEFYFTYLQLQDGIALLEKSIALSQEQIKIEKLKANLGLSTATEVQKKELALSELKDKLEGLKNNLELTGRNLMRQIGQEADLEFHLDSEYSIAGMREDYDPDQLADLSIKNNLDLAVATRSIDKMEDSMKNILAPSARNQVGSQIDAMILGRRNAEQSIKLLARSTASGLALSRQEMALLEKKIDEKTADYETMKLQTSLGLAPKLGLQGTELELDTAKNDLLKAQQNYYLSLRRASLLVKGVAISSAAGTQK
ncbi:MAG: TolC family protein [Clostridiales bacterium]